MIGIIDLGGGNVRAIKNIYKRLNLPTKSISNIEDFSGVDKLILPGVGAFDDFMSSINNSGIRDVLDESVFVKRIPIMGVCVGMQVMAKSSEEGVSTGLGWFDAQVNKFDAKLLTRKPKLPHMGWNVASSVREHEILDGIDEEKGFYFLHSFYFHCNNASNILTTTDYGVNFSSSVQKDNIFGFQFHPEKSHSNGIKVFLNFSEL